MQDNLEKRINGVQAMQRIRESDVDIPVYLMSTNVYPKDYLIEIGATGFIDNSELSEKVPLLIKEYQQ